MKYLLTLLILFLPLPAPSADDAARVVVSDGDMLTALTAKRQAKVRLWGIDAPETGQDFGGRAKQVAFELAFGKEASVREWDRHRYGHTVA